jgi:hypothetical protein
LCNLTVTVPVFQFRRTAFSSQLKSKVVITLAKAAALRVNLNLDGASITSVCYLVYTQFFCHPLCLFIKWELIHFRLHRNDRKVAIQDNAIITNSCGSTMRLKSVQEHFKNRGSGRPSTLLSKLFTTHYYVNEFQILLEERQFRKPLSSL